MNSKRIDCTHSNYDEDTCELGFDLKCYDPSLRCREFEHIDVKHIERERTHFKCKHCQATCKSIETFKHHIVKKHFINMSYHYLDYCTTYTTKVTVYLCCSCNREYLSPESLFRHISKEHYNLYQNEVLSLDEKMKKELEKLFKFHHVLCPSYKSREDFGKLDFFYMFMEQSREDDNSLLGDEKFLEKFFNSKEGDSDGR